jgi:U6 snRNA-associated Sm-like protein LSm8
VTDRESYDFGDGVKCIYKCILILYLLFCFLPTRTEPVCVVTSDGRIILGELVGHDQVQNLILKDAKERVYSSDGSSPPETVELGLYVIRGDNVCLIADYQDDAWTKDDHAAVPPLPPIQQQEQI